MTDLNNGVRHQEAERLQEAGWKEAAGRCRGLPWWRDPETGQVWNQEEALSILVQRESEGGGRD